MTVVSFGNIVRYQAEQKPVGAIALDYPDGTLTWWELERRANQRARHLQSLGVREGDLVTLALPNGLAFHESTFAVWKCGAIPNIVSSRLPAQEFRAIIELARPRAVIGGEPPDVKGVRHVPQDTDVSSFSDASFDAPAYKYWKAMTSGGSTGRPKIIVEHNPAQLDLEAPDLPTLGKIRPGMTILNPGPLYHNAPFVFSHAGLFVGCKIVGMARFDAEEALRLIERHRVNWVNFVPTMMHRIWSLPTQIRDRYDVSSLEVVWHMAAPCPAWLKAAWITWLGGEKIWELYGGTERIGGTIVRGDEWLDKRGTVGRPVNPENLKILKDDGNECAPDEIGEVYFKVPDPPPYHYVGATPKRSAGGWESLGDMGSLDRDGYLMLADRRADLILRGGANIYPAEIEAALDAHPSVGSSVVIGLPCEELGHRVHAIVQARAGASLDLEALDAFLRERIVSYKVPETYEFADHPLRDDAGKVRRSALRDERIAWLAEGRAFRNRPLRPSRS